MSGWFSSRKDKQFDMEHTLTAADHAGAYQIGTPHVLSTAPLIVHLKFSKMLVLNVYVRNLYITRYMLNLIDMN